MEEVEYFHLALERHGVIFADGAASESFLDDDSRGLFNNVHEDHRLYPDDGVPAPEPAPRRLDWGHRIAFQRSRRIALKKPEMTG